MEFADNYIKITDETIISYYKGNPALHFVTMNHIFIDILKNLSTNLTDTVNTTINTNILSMVTDIHSNLNNIKGDLNAIKTDIIIKFHESKKEYIDDIKKILENNTLSNNEKINALVEKNNDNLITKTTLIVNEVIPKGQDKIYTQIENCIKSYCGTITNDTAKLLESTGKDDKQIASIVENIDTQFSKMINTIQQPIFTFIQSSEERTTNGIQTVKEQLASQQTLQQKLTGELNDFLNKYKNNSSSKGNVSEAELYYILQSIMPSDEIIKVGTETATCDFRVNRLDTTKPAILFENKDYSRSVTTEEIKKFERDVQTQRLHGIFISQKSPITYKNEFQIDILNGLIHVYIPSAEYNISKIKIAIDIIDSLSAKLESIANTSDDDFSISREELDEIMEEYKNFVAHKIQMIDMIKTVTKQLTDKLEDIQLPKLKRMFIRSGSIENDNDFKCTFCNSWYGKSKGSLGAHMRNCKSNPKNKDDSTNCVITEPIDVVIETQSLEISDTAATKTKIKSKTNK